MRTIPILVLLAGALLYAGGALSLAAGELAHPAATADDWRVDPAGASQSNADQAAALEAGAGGTWWDWLLGGAAAIAGVVAASRILPGPWQLTVDGLYWLLSTAGGRHARDRERAVSRAGSRIVATIEGMEDLSLIEDLKDRLERALDQDDKDLVEEMRTAIRKHRNRIDPSADEKELES